MGATKSPAAGRDGAECGKARETGKSVRRFYENRSLLDFIPLTRVTRIEVHSWLGRTENLDCPDIDLDPAEGVTFNDVLKIALLVRGALDQSFPKTSGASGLHLFIPINPVYSWGIVTKAMKYIAKLVERVVPDKATTERKVDLRTGKVYLDYLQNGRGKTMAFQYGLWPLPGAPVSTPLEWGEVEEGRIRPGDFNVETIFTRLKAKGDIYAEVLTLKQPLGELAGL